MYWSPYQGEENIVYALNEKSKMLVIYDVDNKNEVPVISYDPGDGTIISEAEIVGFSKDVTSGNLGHPHEIMVNLAYTGGRASGKVYKIFSDRQANGQIGTPSRKIIKQHPRSCDRDMKWFPNPDSIHSSVSPDGLYTAAYWGVAENDFDGNNCIVTSPWELNANRHWKDDTQYEQKLGLTHVSWFGSNDWYIEGNANKNHNLYGEGKPNHPVITDENIYQVFLIES